MSSRYLTERFNLKLKSKPTAKEVKAAKQEKGDWYQRKIAGAAKRFCENCKKPLAGSMVINAATVVAHIIAKRANGGCPSVAYDDSNYMLLCEHCHTKYDTAFSSEIEQMPVYLIAYHRFKTFEHLIPENEKMNVPACFIKALPELFL